METGLHYVDGRETIDAVEIERLVGLARALDLTDIEIAPEGLLADSGTRLIGVDYLSVETPAATGRSTYCSAARAFCFWRSSTSTGSGGDYPLACPPLKLEGGEAAPARVVLIEGAFTAGAA